MHRTTSLICLGLILAATGTTDRIAEAQDRSRARQSVNDQSGRVIWDYRDSAPSKVSLIDYHTWLLDYCRSQKPARLVLYVTTPAIPNHGYCDFYDPTAAPKVGTDLNLVGFLQTMGSESDLQSIDVELLADHSSFKPSNNNPCSSWSGASVTPMVGTLAAPPLPTAKWGKCSGCAADRTVMGLLLNWFGTLASQPSLANGALKGLTIDPEVAGGGSELYLQLALWMDMYRTSGPPAMRDMRLGISVGVESHTFAKLLTGDFPLISSYSVTPYDGVTYLDATRTLTYRTGTTAPLIDSVYLQVYDACAYDKTTNALKGGSFFRWMCAGGADSGVTPTPIGAVSPWTTGPETSANILASTLRRRPRLPGEGMISTVADANIPNPDGNPGGVVLTGSGTRFSLWEQYTRLQLMDGTTPIPPSPEVWSLATPTTNDLTADVVGPRIDQPTLLPYRYTEISIDYSSPIVTADQVDRFWFLFSAEKAATTTPFFGYWTYPNFEAFLNSFSTAVLVPANAPFASALSPTVLPIVKPLQLGIYDLFNASRHWGQPFYSGTAYPSSFYQPEDLNEDGRIDGQDIGGLITTWGTNSITADLNRDGVVDHLDLGELLDAWEN